MRGRLLTKPPNSAIETILCEYYTNIVTRLRPADTTCYITLPFYYSLSHVKLRFWQLIDNKHMMMIHVVALAVNSMSKVGCMSTTLYKQLTSSSSRRGRQAMNSLNMWLMDSHPLFVHRWHTHWLVRRCSKMNCQITGSMWRLKWSAKTAWNSAATDTACCQNTTESSAPAIQHQKKHIHEVCAHWLLNAAFVPHIINGIVLQMFAQQVCSLVEDVADGLPQRAQHGLSVVINWFRIC